MENVCKVRKDRFNENCWCPECHHYGALMDEGFSTINNPYTDSCRLEESRLYHFGDRFLRCRDCGFEVLEEFCEFIYEGKFANAANA